jgi:hypothetical protein
MAARKKVSKSARSKALASKSDKREIKRLKRELENAKRRARYAEKKAAAERARRLAEKKGDARRAKSAAAKPPKTPAPPPTPAPIPSVPNGPAHPGFKPKALLRAVRVQAGAIMATSNISGLRIGKGVVVEPIDADFVSYSLYAVPAPRVAFASADSDSRTSVLVDAFNRVARATPWDAIIGPAHVPRGVRFYASLTFVDTALRRDLIGGSDVESVKVKGGNIKQTVQTWEYGNALNLYGEWLDFIGKKLKRFVNDDASIVKLRLHVSVPLQTGIEGLRARSGMSDEEWAKSNRREVHKRPDYERKTKAEIRRRNRNPREH